MIQLTEEEFEKLHRDAAEMRTIRETGLDEIRADADDMAALFCFALAGSTDEELSRRARKLIDARCCKVPPPGWMCSRRSGHRGPCAASRLVAHV